MSNAKVLSTRCCISGGGLEWTIKSLELRLLFNRVLRYAAIMEQENRLISFDVGAEHQPVLIARKKWQAPQLEIISVAQTNGSINGLFEDNDGIASS